MLATRVGAHSPRPLAWPANSARARPSSKVAAGLERAPSCRWPLAVSVSVSLASSPAGWWTAARVMDNIPRRARLESNRVSRPAGETVKREFGPERGPNLKCQPCLFGRNSSQSNRVSVRPSARLFVHSFVRSFVSPLLPGARVRARAPPPNQFRWRLAQAGRQVEAPSRGRFLHTNRSSRALSDKLT